MQSRSSPGMMTLLANEVSEERGATSPRPASQSQSGRRRAERALSLGRLMDEGLLQVGDRLTFGTRTALVKKAGWLEAGRDTLSLEAFVAAAVGKMRQLAADEKDEILQFGPLAYSLLRVNDSAVTLAQLSAECDARAKTLKVDLPPMQSSRSDRGRGAVRRQLALAAGKLVAKQENEEEEKASQEEHLGSLQMSAAEDSSALSLANDDDCDNDLHHLGANSNAPPAPHQAASELPATVAPEAFSIPLHEMSTQLPADAADIFGDDDEIVPGSPTTVQHTAKRVRRSASPMVPEYDEDGGEDDNDDDDGDDLVDLMLEDESLHSVNKRQRSEPPQLSEKKNQHRQQLGQQPPPPRRPSSLSQQSSALGKRSGSHRQDSSSSSQPIIIVVDESSSQERSPTPVKPERQPKRKSLTQPAPRVKSDVAKEIEEERRQLEMSKRFLAATSASATSPSVTGPSPDKKLKPAAAVAASPSSPSHQHTFATPQRPAYFVPRRAVAETPNNGASPERLSSVTKPVLISSGLDSGKIASIAAAASTLTRGELVNEWSPRVTHVVIRLKDDGRCRRTVKYLLGVLSGAFVVSYDWVVQSRAAAAWLDEMAFLAFDDHFNVGENVVKTSLRRFQRGLPPLFHGYSFYLHGGFDGSAVSRDELELLIRVGGGQLLESDTLPADLTEKAFIICSPDISATESDAIFHKTGRDPVFFLWLLDCVSDLSILPVRKSSLYKKTFNEDEAAGGINLFQTQNSPAL